MHVRAPCDEGVVLAGRGEAPSRQKPQAPQTSQTTRSTERWVLAATILGSSMAFIDGTVVNVALPALQRVSAPRSPRCSGWSRPMPSSSPRCCWSAAPLGDRFGRRRVFLWGVAVFALASAGCGLAPSVGQLIAARAVQGIGAALLVPGSLALISASFDGDAARPGHRHLVGLRRRSPRRSGRCWAAGWSTTPRGAGCSSSTCRSPWRCS